MTGSSTTVQAPATSPAQSALEQAQANSLNQQSGIISQQANTENLLAPYLYQNMGLTPQYTNGQISGFTQSPQVAENTSLQNTVEGQYLSQEQQALSGTLPVNPAVSNSLATSQNTLGDQLTASLGPNYAASTAGAQAENNFAAQKAGVIFGANTGQMTLDQQLAAASGASGVQTSGGTNSNAAGVWGLPSTSVGELSSLASGYGSAQQPYELQSQEQLQASEQSALLSQGTLGSILGSIGSLGGAALGSLGPYGSLGPSGGLNPNSSNFIFSDRRLKEDIKEVGVSPSGLPIYEFKYLGEMLKHIGFMADEVEQINPDAVVEHSSGFKMVDYIKALELT